jgi:hypothetical protein
MILLPKRIAENTHRFTSRAWLLPEALTWWDKKTDQRLFLIAGGPGTGKSMILAWYMSDKHLGHTLHGQNLTRVDSGAGAAEGSRGEGNDGRPNDWFFTEQASLAGRDLRAGEAAAREVRRARPRKWR